ncbi:Dipeptidyl aminopeptidase/acylaminoacyl peptidase [Jatrophihabitans endophyticus]|uniref:Dipeptidyl aminopeptidase/acylaminoacyl peptidase n=1 Tax=Jatrophihabitans endophyticus TaxID=1206085 RepID=A0A1M5MY61_9ACTN|nr:prolyl oligopeptidase family serine peptidase [Jatrophihabitans endophyticus]SHG81673.1 Dipeptidyl aminopeptidase/acylaminoacyl peptidase [Jatrophihabitans endophyticus]
MTVAPYGSWRSPISATSLATGGHAVGGARFVGEDVWWLEARPEESGRYAIRRHGQHGVEDVLPAPWNARTRVHEYGGGAWTATPDGIVVFAEFGDQRLYRLDEPGGTPVPLTPEPPEPGAWRYGELAFLRVGEVWCVRERHAADGTITRDIAAVPVDGSAAADDSRVRSVVAGSRFLAAPRISPDGRRLAWIAWEHPQLPWDGTELRVAELGADGVAGEARTLLGSTTESVLQPEWRDTSSLYALTDRTGFWNLHVVGVDGDAAPVPVAPVAADIGGPLWQLGARWYAVLPDDRLLVVRTVGTDTLAVLDPGAGTYADVDLGDHTTVQLGPYRDGTVLLTTHGARTPSGIRRFDLTDLTDLTDGVTTDVRLAVDEVPDDAYLPLAEQHTFAGEAGREVHAVVYRPRNAGYEAPAGERPPFVAFVHGGPTAHVTPMLSPSVAYYTSRGIGVVDVNYGGSTGYGRAYREQLRGQWGVVDVEDTVSAVRGLADAGIADGARLGIEGGSAGGWTVLSALTTTDVFACGVSHFGVAELVRFAQETHDFESRYLDGLVGPLPEARELYDQRAPVNNVEGLSCPVLLLQGLDDPIVPPSQAERFRDAMIAKGLPHAYRAYEGESHGFRRRETIVDARESALSFYGQVFGFEPPDVPALELTRP